MVCHVRLIKFIRIAGAMYAHFWLFCVQGAVGFVKKEETQESYCTAIL